MRTVCTFSGSSIWAHRDLPRYAAPASWGRSAPRGSFLWTRWTRRSCCNHLSPFILSQHRGASQTEQGIESGCREVADSLGFLRVGKTAFVSRAVSALYPADGLRPKLAARNPASCQPGACLFHLFSTPLCLSGCREAGEPSFVALDQTRRNRAPR